MASDVEMFPFDDVIMNNEKNMTLWQGSAFRITDPLWGECTGHRSFDISCVFSPNKFLNKELNIVMFALKDWYFSLLPTLSIFIYVGWPACMFVSSITENLWKDFHEISRRGRNGGMSICWQHWRKTYHYNDVIMSAMACQITSLTIAYSTVYSGTDQRKHQSSASLAFVRGIHRWPVNSPHKGPVMRKMFPFDDVMTWTAFSGIMKEGM